MISDDDLLLYYYRDGLDAAERARIGTALAEQPELAQRLHRLVAQLDTVAEMPEVPVPAHIEQRWQSALQRAAAARNIYVAAAGTGCRFRTTFRWQALAATVVAVAILVTIQVSMQSRPDRTAGKAPTATTQPAASTPDTAAYERGLRWHLANTEQRLARLDSAQPEERALLVETIIEQNRLYALAAERANEPQLARVLRAFTPILESLAVEHSDASASDIAQLSFEMRVMQARLKAAADPSPRAQNIAL
jgi:hypothetical protein